jgi:hypothetical protein
LLIHISSSMTLRYVCSCIFEKFIFKQRFAHLTTFFLYVNYEFDVWTAFRKSTLFSLFFSSKNAGGLAPVAPKDAAPLMNIILLIHLIYLA